MRATAETQSGVHVRDDHIVHSGRTHVYSRQEPERIGLLEPVLSRHALSVEATVHSAVRSLLRTSQKK